MALSASQNTQVNMRLYPSLDFMSSMLVGVIQDLSSAHSLSDVMRVVRVTARQIAHADGATFVLRENDQCHYADEDAISSLWKGMKFPMSACISGWCMLHKEQVVIQDIYQDARIPHDAYRPTFVKSLVMTPVRKENPIAAIGTYWAKTYMPTAQELDSLQALADATSIAMRNVDALRELEHRVRELDRANQYLSRLTWMASHDLKEPLRGLNIQATLLEKQLAAISGDNEDDLSPKRQSLIHLEKIKLSCSQANGLVTDLLEAARTDNHELSLRKIDLNELVVNVLSTLEAQVKEKQAQVRFCNLPEVYADPVLLSRLLQNLLSNAIKFQHEHAVPIVEIFAEAVNGNWKISVRDNGIGIEREHHDKIFDFFTRLHGKAEFPGSGIGLALCKTIVGKLGGTIGVESEAGAGSCFYFTLARSVV